MSKNLYHPVAYLEMSDFNDSGEIINNEILQQNKPIVVMFSADFCGYCTKSKPSYQKFADNNKDKVFCATIQADGKKPGEVKLAQILKKINPDFEGFPDYVLFNKEGKRIPKAIKGREEKHLVDFAIDKKKI